MGKYENQIKNAKWKKGLILTLISHLNKKVTTTLYRQTPLMYYIKNNSVTIIRTHLSNYKEKNDGMCGNAVQFF
jgi:hypothetical protein